MIGAENVDICGDFDVICLCTQVSIAVDSVGLIPTQADRLHVSHGTFELIAVDAGVDYVGGLNNVRGYRQDALLTDSGWFVSVETEALTPFKGKISFS